MQFAVHYKSTILVCEAEDRCRGRGGRAWQVKRAYI